MKLADSLVEAAVLAYLGDSVRLERVWDSGSDHSAELTRLNTEIEDMVRLIGSPAYPAGSPQRTALDANVSAMAERQQKLAAEAVKPAGWEWRPTGEKFSDWWERQDVASRNIWLRSNGIRFDFDGENNCHLQMGALDELLKQLVPGEIAKSAQDAFAAMRVAGIAGTEINGDVVTVHLTNGHRFFVDMKPHELTPEEEASAADFYGWNRATDG